MSSAKHSISDKLNYETRLNHIKDAIKLNMFDFVRAQSKGLNLSKEGPNLLRLCMIYGALDCLQLLITKRGVDPNGLDSDGETALHIAARTAEFNRSQDLGLIFLLLNNKANPNTPNARGRTVWQEYPKVFERVKLNMFDFVRAQSKGLNLSKEGPNLLRLCMIYGALDCLQLLITKRGVDPNGLDSDGETALHIAARTAEFNRSQDLGLIFLLLNNKANPNTPNARGRTVWQEYPKVFERVLPTILKDLDKHFDQISNAEYVIFKCEHGQITGDFTAEEYDAIHQLIFTYAYPMNQNPLYKDTLDRLSVSEQEELCNFEKRFLQRRLKQINPNAHIFPIIKSLYQLFIVLSDMGFIVNPDQFKLSLEISASKNAAKKLEQELERDRSKITTFDSSEVGASDSSEAEASEKNPKNEQVKLKLETKEGQDEEQSRVKPEKKTSLEDFIMSIEAKLKKKTMTELLFNPNQETFFQDCHDYNFFPTVKNVWRLANIALVTELRKRNFLNPKLTGDLCAEWLSTANHQLKDTQRKDTFLSTYDETNALDLFIGEENQVNQALLQFLIKTEFNLSFKNPGFYIVDRGGSPKVDLERFEACHKDKQSCSTSFSDGILAGYTNDLHTGCALFYMMERKAKLEKVKFENVATTFGYKAFIFKGKQSLFSVPPVCNLGRVNGMNELHHVRTRMSKEDLPAGPLGTQHCVKAPFLHNDLGYPKHMEILRRFWNTSIYVCKDHSTVPKLLKQKGFSTLSMFDQFRDDQNLLTKTQASKDKGKVLKPRRMSL